MVEVSPLGLVEMTRQNVTEGVREILTKRCPTCDGEGVVRVRGDGRDRGPAASCARSSRSDPKPEAYLIRVNPKVAAELLHPDSGLTELEAETGKHFHFEGGDALPIDTFEVIESGTRAKIEEQALPFQVGEEVLVTIEEPHMFNADDAIARVDSYIVSVTGGNSHVGQRRMVRIESVERSAAVATLLEGSNGRRRRRARRWRRELQSPATRRRRGRRGGRRRSRAKSAESGGIRRLLMSDYAIVESGGKQYRAEKGGTLVVDRLSEDEGAKVTLRPVMFRADKKVVLDPGELDKVKVEAVVAGHERGTKVRVFKYRAKKGYRRRAGHRSELTRLEVTDVKLLTRKPAGAEAAKAEPRRSRRRAKPAAKKPAAKKPAAKKPAAKKPAAKKPAAKKPASRSSSAKKS